MAAKKTAPAKKAAERKSAAAKPADPAKPARKKPTAGHRARIGRPPERVVPLADGELSPAAAAEAPSQVVLSEKMQLFVREYLVDRNATRAYMRTFPGGTPNTARTESSLLLRIPEVAGAIAAGMAALQRNAECSADEVVRRLCRMATADEREIMQVRVGCCRYCWGKDHRYQYTAAEMERAEAEHAEAVERDEASGDFDTKGGVGFNATDPPNQDCPECFGEGRPRTVFNDTRNLSEGAAMLFAGVKETREGFEVKTHSRADALVQLGRHFGIFTDKFKGELKVDAAEELREFLAARGGSRLPIGDQES